MYIDAEIVLKSYKPLELEEGMFFVNKIARTNAIELFILEELPDDEEKFVVTHGYPVEPYIVQHELLNNVETPIILATPEQIGWFDQGSYSDEISDITIRQINTIFSDYDGYLNIEFDHITNQPTLYDNKVTIRYVDDESGEDWEALDDEFFGELDDNEQNNNEDDFENRVVND